LCDVVTHQWDVLGQPPKAGVQLEEMGTEFERICKVDVEKMWFKDEQTRQFDCVIDGARVSIANSFFPNILKAKDTVGEGKAVSVYDLFAKQSARPKTLDVLTRCIRKDGFYDFSPIYRPPTSFKGDLRREARRITEEILTEEASGSGQRALCMESMIRQSVCCHSYSDTWSLAQALPQTTFPLPSPACYTSTPPTDASVKRRS